MFYAIDEFDVKFSEDRTTLIKAPKTLTGEYIVPKSVTKIQDSAFRNCTSLEKITLPPHLEYLGSHTFSHCDKIISIIFNQESVLQSIGDCCFSNCGQLEAIELPQTIKEIGQYAFYNCQSLKQIKIPDDCICNNSSFDSCLSLCEINIPKSWIEIPSKVFYNCSSLERIKLPNSAKKIGEQAFGKCSNLLSVDIGDGVEEIIDSAFDECSNLRKIRFGFNLKKIGRFVFKKCYKLHTVFWEAINCCDFSESDLPFPEDRKIHFIHFGDSVKHIPSFLCANQCDIEEVVIPDTVETIGTRAFFQCNPRYIYINKNITPDELRDILGTNFTHNLFFYFNKIEEFSVSNQNTYYAEKNGDLYNKDFSELIKICSNWQNLNLKVKKICDFAGAGLKNLYSLHIEDCSVIGKYAFCDCTNLCSLGISGSESTKISASAFCNCTKLENIYWNIENNDDFPNRDDFTISHFESLYPPICYNGEETIKCDFSEQIQNLKLGKDITKIPTFASKLLGIKYLYIPNNIKDFNQGLPPKIEEVEFEESDDENYFSFENGFILDNGRRTILRYIGCTESIIVPNGISTIGPNAFSYSSIKQIILPESVTKIGEASFKGSKLKKFTAPSNLEVIESYAFMDCCYLQNISLNSNLKKINKSAFENCTSLKRLKIPNATEYESSIVAGCSSLSDIKIKYDWFYLKGLTSLQKVEWDCKKIRDREGRGYPYFEEFKGSSHRFDIFAKYRRIGSKYYYNSKESVAHQIKNLIFTENVEEIPDNFANYMSIKEVDIPKSVKYIGNFAFYYCFELECINIHSMDIEMGENFCHFQKKGFIILNEKIECKQTKILFEGSDITKFFEKKNREKISGRKFAEAEAEDFRRYLEDSFYGAFEGENDPNGDYL